MKMKKFFGLLMAFSIFIFFTCAVQAGEATDRIKAATDKLVEIITDHDLDAPDMAETRAHMIRETVDQVFNWSAFSQRALGRHWRKLSQKEKDEFTFLFGQLIEQTYMDKTRQYSGEKLNFIREETEGKYGVVDAEGIKGGANIAIQFRIMKVNEKWYIYDVYVEGVSLVNNYRVQFNNILIKSGYNELLDKLKSKLNS